MGSKGSSPKLGARAKEPGNRHVREGLSRNVEKQWVDRVLKFSSQYDSNSWCADTVIGPPKVYPRYGDTPGAWASRAIDANQFLELHYKIPVYIEQINIYETYNAGGVRRILARGDGGGDWQILWKAERLEKIQHSRIFSPAVTDIGVRCSDIRIEVDCTAAGTWVEIDAVELVGVTTYLPPPPGMDELSEDFSTLVNNEKFSDIQFSVGDRMVYAHKAVLMARSDYFRAMFCDQMKEAVTKGPITLKDVKFDEFYAVLHYLYTNKIPTYYKTEQLAEIWRVADRFSVEGLKTTAAYTICNGLDKENVVDIYCSATNHLPVIDEIRDSCVEFMRGHMSSIVKTPSFVDLSKDIMLEIVQLTNQMKIS